MGLHKKILCERPEIQSQTGGSGLRYFSHPTERWIASVNESVLCTLSVEYTTRTYDFITAVRTVCPCPKNNNLPILADVGNSVLEVEDILIDSS